MPRQLAPAAVVLVLVILLGCSGFGLDSKQRDPAAEADATATPASELAPMGQAGVTQGPSGVPGMPPGFDPNRRWLLRGPDGGNVPLCATAEIAAQYAQAVAGKDALLARQLVGMGLVIVVPANSEAIAALTGMPHVEIRILSGPYAQGAGWVSVEYLRDPAEEPPPPPSKGQGAKTAPIGKAPAVPVKPKDAKLIRAEAADSLLRVAKLLLNDDRRRGREKLLEVMDKYPGTKAAEEALKLLEEPK